MLPIGEVLLPCHRQARWGSSWRRPNGRFGSILFTFSMRVKQLVQRGPGDTQLSRQRRLADLPVHVPPVVPGQVRDDHSFAAVVPTLTFRDCDSLPLAFQQVGPLKLLNFPANCKKMQFSISDLQHRYLNTAVKLGYSLFYVQQELYLASSRRHWDRQENSTSGIGQTQQS